MKLRHILFVAFLLFYENGQAQYIPINNADSLEKIYAKILDYVATSVDTINLTVFKNIKAQKQKVIYYETFDTSHFKKVFPELLRNPGFKNLLNKSNEGLPELVIHSRGSLTKFILINKSSPLKMECRLEIYPPGKFERNIGVWVSARSPGYDDDMYGGYLYFQFNENLQLLQIYKSEIIY